MKQLIKLIIAILFLNIIISPLFADQHSDASKYYHEGNIAYQKLDYESAIKSYEQLIKTGFVSEEMFYNLGNAYFKTGNTPKAILNYERALKIHPDDEDAQFNLKIASLKVVDKIEAVPEIFYKHWINGISSALPARVWAILLISLIWILFAAASFYYLAGTVLLKKISFIALVAVFFLSGITGVMAARSHADTNVDVTAIIMSSSVYVKSSPSEKGNDVFILHEGTKLEVLDELNEWRKIRIANGSVGWMKADAIETI